MNVQCLLGPFKSPRQLFARDIICTLFEWHGMELGRLTLHSSHGEVCLRCQRCRRFCSFANLPFCERLPSRTMNLSISVRRGTVQSNSRFYLEAIRSQSILSAKLDAWRHILRRGPQRDQYRGEGREIFHFTSDQEDLSYVNALPHMYRQIHASIYDCHSSYHNNFSLRTIQHSRQ